MTTRLVHPNRLQHASNKPALTIGCYLQIRKKKRDFSQDDAGADFLFFAFCNNKMVWRGPKLLTRALMRNKVIFSRPKWYRIAIRDAFLPLCEALFISYRKAVTQFGWRASSVSESESFGKRLDNSLLLLKKFFLQKRKFWFLSNKKFSNNFFLLHWV